MTRPLASCAVTALVTLYAAGASPGIDARFAHPPADARILKIIHSWPDRPEAQDSLIATLNRQGFGGVVCNVSFDQYLESEPKWQAFTRAADQAKKSGMAMWLYDERGYPSANAGGLTLRGHPEWEARGLLIADAESKGGDVTLESPPGQLVLAAAFPQRDGAIDLAAKVDIASHLHQGALRWQAPPGEWRVMLITESRLYEGTHADGNLHARMPYPNLLMREPTQRFIELTHDAYASRLGRNLGSYFMGLFTDEPSLMSLFLRPMPYRPLPWSAQLPDEFKKRRGYALETGMIPALLTEAGPRTRKLRHDFWRTIGDLVSENYFGQLQSFGRAHGIPSGGHLLAEESIAAHTALYGDFFQCIRRLDAPGIDCLTSLPPEVPWYIARLLASAAELEGRRLVMSETSDHGQRYRAAGDTRPKRLVTEAEIRGTCNRLMVSGVNSITSYYSFAELPDDALQRLNEWVGRSCTMLRGGRQVADIAVLYPSESLWTHFVPSHHWAREATAAGRIETWYRTAADLLFAAQRDFTFIDGRAIAEAAIEEGALVHGQLRWRVVILPGADTLPLAAWENLARFVRAGGAVVALGSRPANSDTEFPSKRAQALGAEIFGDTAGGPSSRSNGKHGTGVFLPAGSEGVLGLVLDGLIEKDVAVQGARAPVRVTHRHADAHELYFVSNDGAAPWSGDVTFAAGGAAEQWDPGTGKKAGIDAGKPVHLTLDRYGAAIFRFSAARVPARYEPGAGMLPGFSFRDLPAVVPHEGHGEFVRGELSRDPTGSPSARWKAAATLTKGEVDTHLFLQFRFPKPLDLSDAECLAFDTWTPAGQRTTAQLLVILHEENGGDFVVSTGRSLGTAGTDRILVPLSRFELAGWSRSRDADGLLDLKRVQDIRIGWGGYFGKEGEKVDFTVSTPQAGILDAARRH